MREEQHHEQAAQAERQPSALVPQAPVPATLLRGASNAAVAAMLARSPAGGRTLARTPAQDEMRALEETMTVVKTGATARAAEFNRLGDESVQALQDAERHLRVSSANYREAYGRFTGKLDEADERFATEQAIKDAVQGILVAAALAAVGPELLIVKGGTALVEATATTTARAIAQAGFAGGVGEVAEMGGGAVVSGARGPAVRPGSTAAGGGPTAGDKYEEAFAKLGELVAVMPKLGRAATASMNIGTFAGDIQTEAVRLSGGVTGRWTEAQVRDKAAVAQSANTQAAGSLVPARNAAARVAVLEEQITSAPIKTADEIERLIWTTWMATLEGDANEVLDNDVIQRYLTSMGLIAPGSYMSDADQADAVRGARRDVLRQRGVDVDAAGAQIDSLYRREMKLDEFTRRILNKRGRISANDRVTVDGLTFDAPGSFGGSPVGTEVTATLIIVKPHLQGPTINIAHWNESDYDVLGVTVASQEAFAAQTAVPQPDQAAAATPAAAVP